MSKDRKERRHRRTWQHPEAMSMMASADFNRVPNLSEAMGLEEPVSKRPQIEGLSVSRVDAVPVSKDSIAVSLDGISGGDFLACCNDEELLREIVQGLDPHTVADAMGWEMPEDRP